MREILRSNDPVLVSFTESLLNDAGFSPLVADRHISVIEGSLGVFPRRILVPPEYWAEAHELLCDAGLAKWLIDHAE
jgi:hypothetical protein